MAGKERIETLLKQLLPVCESWLQQKEGETYFVDPLDGKEIYAHYGATHMAAALILYGKMSRQEGLYNKGIVLLAYLFLLVGFSEVKSFKCITNLICSRSIIKWKSQRNRRI